MPGKKIRRRRRSGRTASKKGAKAFVLNRKKGLFFSVILLVLALLEFFNPGDLSAWFWVYFVLGALILLPNTVWSFFNFSNKFIIPYFLVMVKTKKFVGAIKSAARFGKFWEKICALGIILGFGLAGADYWFAKKFSKGERVIFLAVSAILLYLFIIFVLDAAFSKIFEVELLKPLVLPIIIGFVLLGFGGFSFAMLIGYGFISLNSFFTSTQVCPSFAPVLPGVPIPGLGVVIPLVGWVSLGIILVLHEGSHGVMLAYYAKKIRSVGLLMVGIFPMGAFVEEDPEEFRALDGRKKLLMLSAGSTVNLATIPVSFLLILLFNFAVIGPLDNSIDSFYDGLVVDSVDQNISFCGVTKPGPSYGKIFPGDRVVSINGTEILKASDINLSAFNDNNVSLVVSRDGNLVPAEIFPAEFENIGIKKIGAQMTIVASREVPFWLKFLVWLSQSIWWILVILLVLSLAIGTLNYIPVDPFDGGKMAKIILLSYFGFLKMPKNDTERFIGRFFLWLFIGALLLNLIPYVTMVF